MGTVKKQKRARKRALKSRYCAGAKLSEHKFLRLLRGYAEGTTPFALKPKTHASSKTIRATYRALRDRLTDATLEEPEKFGGAGLLLNLPEASALLDAIKASAQFRRYRKRHTPRMKDAHAERLLVLEFAVRVFCALDLRNAVAESAPVLLSLANGLGMLKARDPLQKLAESIPGAKPFAYPELRLYEDYRRYLLKHPLGSQ